MPIFNSIEELTRYVATVTMEEMSNIVENATEEELTNQLRETVYNNSASSDYDNTFSLLNAINTTTVAVGGRAKEIEIETHIDPNMMDYNYESYYLDGGNADNRENIVGWLNDGHGGFYKGYAINYDGRHFIEKAKFKINRELRMTIMRRLKARGYKFGYAPKSKSE